MSEIKIDESKHRKVPSLFQRLKHAVLAVVAGIIFAQAVLFVIGFGSIILWYNGAIFYIYLGICAVMGAIYGDAFIFTLNNESSHWWDLWGHWKNMGLWK